MMATRIRSPRAVGRCRVPAALGFLLQPRTRRASLETLSSALALASSPYSTWSCARTRSCIPAAQYSASDSMTGVPLTGPAKRMVLRRTSTSMPAPVTWEP